MNDLQIFDNEQFGKVRAVEIDGEPWFVGKDVAAALGYGNASDAIARHVDTEDRRVSRFPTPSGIQEMTIINESGLYALIFGSKLPKAKKFKHWVTSDILPKLRKTGTYSIDNHAAQVVSAGGVAELIRITRRAMLDAGHTPQDVIAMVKHQYQVWCIPVSPTLQHPAQLNLFSPEYQAITGGEQT